MGNAALRSHRPAVVDFLAGTAGAQAPGLSRRQRLLGAMSALERYEDELANALRAGIRALPGARLHGQAELRTPTISFSLAGLSTEEVATALGKQEICINHGNHYALELIRRLGIDEDAGVLRAGIAPYNTRADINRLLSALEGLVAAG